MPLWHCLLKAQCTFGRKSDSWDVGSVWVYYSLRPVQVFSWKTILGDKPNLNLQIFEIHRFRTKMHEMWAFQVKCNFKCKWNRISNCSSPGIHDRKTLTSCANSDCVYIAGETISTVVLVGIIIISVLIIGIIMAVHIVHSVSQEETFI